MKRVNGNQLRNSIISRKNSEEKKNEIKAKRKKENKKENLILFKKIKVKY